MRSEIYQRAAMRTCRVPAGSKQAIIEAAMGLAGESGEVIDIVKKNVFGGHPMEEDKIILELGDILWYIAEMAHGLGVSLETVMERNIQKLEKRYPVGFSTQASLERKDVNVGNTGN